MNYISIIYNCFCLFEWEVSAASTGKSRIFNDDGTPTKSLGGDNIAYTEQRESSVYDDQTAGKQNPNHQDKSVIQRDNLRSSKAKGGGNGTSNFNLYSFLDLFGDSWDRLVL